MDSADARLPPSLRGRPCYYDGHRVAHCARPGEHIVFMGDSLTRYQWLALAASFHRRVELSDQEYPSLVKEREWRHWMPFYNGSTDALMPNSRCDCHRTFARPVGSKTVENRYFWMERPPSNGRGGRSGRNAHAARQLLNLSFVQVLTPETIFGHWTPTGANSDERLREGIHPEFAPRWRMNWLQVMREVVAKLQPPPTVLLLNMGLWSGPPNASYAAELARVAHSIAPRVVWKTTTRMRKSGPTKWLRTDLVPRRIFREVFDAARLTRGLIDRDYWDPRHFQPRVYNNLNAALLRQLYGPPTQCDEFSHGRCLRGREPTPASAPSEIERAEVAAAANPAEGWSGVATRHPADWNPLQTMLWVDALGISYDAKQFANRNINGSALLALSPAGFDELGVGVGAQRKLRAALRARAPTGRDGDNGEQPRQVNAASAGR